jgi:hypothetical protein
MNELDEIIAALVLAYPNNKEMSPNNIKVYQRYLRDLDLKDLSAAVAHHISTNKWFPAISDLRSTVADLQAKAAGVPSPTEAWGLVLRFAGGEVELTVHPFVNQAVQQISSWYNLRMSTTQVADRARFLQAYERIVSDAKEGAMMLPEVKGYIGAGYPALLKQNPTDTDGPQETFAEVHW